jgi:hypothetical protein
MRGSQLPWVRSILHLYWLLHDDIERGHEAENDGKEVDDQPGA